MILQEVQFSQISNFRGNGTRELIISKISNNYWKFELISYHESKIREKNVSYNVVS